MSYSDKDKDFSVVGVVTPTLNETERTTTDIDENDSYDDPHRSVLSHQNERY